MPVSSFKPLTTAPKATTVADDSSFGQGNGNKVEVLPENMNRISAVITALAGNADTIRVGDTNVDTTQGIPLAPGETLLWPSTAGVFVCSEGAGSNDVALLENTL